MKQTEANTQNHTGGKAEHMQRMLDAGFNVPPFFAIGHRECAALFEPVLHRVEALLHTPPDSRSLPEVSNQIRQLILNCPIDPASEAAILQKARHLFGNNYMVSVRSSALSEDGTKTSFAGQHETLLYVQPGGLIQAIKASMASAWGVGVLQYRLIHGMILQHIQYAMLVQQMVEAESAGVAFSMNSRGNMADAVINAGFGAGEGIVADKVEADTYYVNRGVKSIRKTVVHKTLALRYTPEGLREVPLEPALRDRPVLSDTQILAVAEAALKAEQLLRKPADIEFVFDASGALWMLQMRPITTIRAQNLHILDNANIIESYPGITLPLSFSFARNAYSRLFRNSASAFWVSADRFDAEGGIFDHLIVHMHGRVYYRLDNWYKMMALVYNSKRAMKDWENAVGLPDSMSDRYAFPLLGQLKTLASVAWLIATYQRGNRQFFRRFETCYRDFKQYHLHTESPDALWRHFEACMDHTFKFWYLTIVNDYLAFKTFGWLRHLLKRFKVSEQDEFANELVGGSGEVESELAVVSLLELKDRVEATPELMALFKLPDETVLNTLMADSGMTDPAIQAFALQLQKHLDRFGDRTLAELKLETPSPRTHPELLLQLIRSQLGSKMHASDYRTRQIRIREKAFGHIRSRYPVWHPVHWLLRTVTGMASYGLRNRENMRFCRTRLYSASKDIFHAFGRMLYRDACIEQPEDVFYLHMEELQAWSANRAAGAHYKATVAERRALFAGYAALQLPDRIIYAADDAPEAAYFEPRDAQRHATAWTADSRKGMVLNGTAVSKGIVEGEALVLLEPVLNADVRGKILISRMTDPGWVFLMSQAVALVSEKGSLLSHTAIVGRELGIPVVVGVTDVCAKIKTGDRIRVDATRGTVSILND